MPDRDNAELWERTIGCQRMQGYAHLRRDNQDERPYCLTGKCYPVSDRCLIEMLPLPHALGGDS